MLSKKRLLTLKDDIEYAIENEDGVSSINITLEELLEFVETFLHFKSQS